MNCMIMAGRPGPTKSAASQKLWNNAPNVNSCQKTASDYLHIKLWRAVPDKSANTYLIEVAM